MRPHPSTSLRAGFLAQRAREKWGTLAGSGQECPLHTNQGNPESL